MIRALPLLSLGLLWAACDPCLTMGADPDVVQAASNVGPRTFDLSVVGGAVVCEDALIVSGVEAIASAPAIFHAGDEIGYALGGEQITCTVSQSGEDLGYVRGLETVDQGLQCNCGFDEYTAAGEPFGPCE